jgi:hypothetical protein
MNGYFDRHQTGSLSWLMSLDDASFIEGVFNVVLGRQADPVGTEHYLSILKKRGAASKLFLIFIIPRAEGRRSIRC